VAIGHALGALSVLADLLPDPRAARLFAARQLGNPRAATSAKARKFLKARGSGGFTLKQSVTKYLPIRSLTVAALFGAARVSYQEVWQQAITAVTLSTFTLNDAEVFRCRGEDLAAGFC